MTSFQDPYPKEKIVKVAVNVGKTDYDFLFEDLCPLFGARTRITGQLLRAFILFVRTNYHPDLLTSPYEREQNVRKLLSEFITGRAAS